MLTYIDQPVATALKIRLLPIGLKLFGIDFDSVYMFFIYLFPSYSKNAFQLFSFHGLLSGILREKK